MGSKIKALGLVSIVSILLLAVAFALYTQNRDLTVKSAKELKISASDLGEGWIESFSYMSDPVEALNEFYKKTGEIEFEISELKKNGVKDGYLLILKKTESPKSLVEVVVFVFNSTNGARNFFDFMKNKIGATDTSGIGDETALFLTETSRIQLVRYSNAFIKVITWDGQNTGRIIAEKIIEKAVNKVRK